MHEFLLLYCPAFGSNINTVVFRNESFQFLTGVNMKKLAVAVCLLMMPFTLAWSAGYGIVYGAKVVNIRVDQTGLGMVFFDQPIVNTPPTCVIPMYSKALAFNAATAGGKAILALALTARLTGTPINYVVGSGTCSIYSNFVEDWGYNE